jgi:hypothetical protein
MALIGYFGWMSSCPRPTCTEHVHCLREQTFGRPVPEKCVRDRADC